MTRPQAIDGERLAELLQEIIGRLRAPETVRLMTPAHVATLLELALRAARDAGHAREGGA